jgi:hypothetical protein
MAVVEGAAGPAPPELRPRAGTASPDASIVVPVNAQGDPENVLTLLRLHAEGLLADELNVGPAAKSRGARIVYSGDRRVPVYRANRPVR